MKTRFMWLLWLSAGAALLFGGATVNQLYVSYALTGDAGRQTGTLVFDPPFTFTRNAAGQVHVGLAPVTGGSTQILLDGAPIGTRPSLDFRAGLNTVLAASDTGSAISLQISAPGWCQFKADGSLSGCTTALSFGRGFLTAPPAPVADTGAPLSEVILDIDWVMSRVPLPAGGAVPGRCVIGQSAYMIDGDGYEYRCFPTAADPTLYELRRSPQPWVNTW